MIRGKNLIDSSITITSILIKGSMLKCAFLEHVSFGHSDIDLTRPRWNAWVEKSRQVILDRAGDSNSKNFRDVYYFEYFGNTGDGSDSSSSTGSSDTNNSNNCRYVWAMGYLGGSSNSSNRTNIKTTSETIIRIGILAKAVIGM